MRVLVVEDDEKIAAFVENGLREAGLAVDATGDGEQTSHGPGGHLFNIAAGRAPR